jgi:hypothetical protein
MTITIILYDVITSVLYNSRVPWSPQHRLRHYK